MDKVRIAKHDNALSILVIIGIGLIVICWFFSGQPGFDEIIKPWQDMGKSFLSAFFSNPNAY